ncbi:MAG: hypothetical protein H6814_00895 [Phycisphaeraceae bacterium]|nr:hypothetical protein [Phycisphaeraceae bacterium]
MKTTAIAAALCAGLATTAFAASDALRPIDPTTRGRMEIVESLTRLAENDPTDATIRMKLALALDSVGLHEEAAWWREDAMHINPEIANNGVLESGPDVPLHDLIARGAGIGSVCNQPIGPDVIVGNLHDLRRWGTVGGQTSYSVGTTSCNIGDEWLDWLDNNVNHPVIAQDMFKYEPFSVGNSNGRFKQLGQSWLKHGFFALSNNICCPSCSSTNGTHLGVGCADPYGASLNGSFSELGPRSEVNGATGFFYQYPHSSPSGDTTLRGRIIVDNTELDQANALNADSLYVVDGLYIAKDDALEGNDNNNSSYRTINVSSSGTTHNISFLGSTQREACAIQHWAEVEAGVTNRFVDVAGDGRYIVAYHATDNGNGTWHYEYAVYNLNSEDAAVTFSVPCDSSVNVSNISFHDVDSHSGEPYDNTDWSGSHSSNNVTWSAPGFSPSADRNAIRWGTLYNFGFDADTEPQNVSMNLGQLSGGSTPSFTVSAPMDGAPPCLGDINGDGVIDTADLGILLGDFGAHGVLPTDLNGDNTVDTADLGILLGIFNTVCP